MNECDFSVRRMTLSDVDAVYEIENAVFPTPWTRNDFVKEMTANRCARYLVAEKDGGILAYAGAWIVLDEAHITNIAVKEPYRGKGIGKTITRELIRYAANLGVAYMTLEVRKSNIIAQSLYRELGFIKLGTRKKYYENNGEDALIMVLDHMPPADAGFTEPETLFEASDEH